MLVSGNNRFLAYPVSKMDSIPQHLPLPEPDLSDRDVLIVGGSISGLTVARALAMNGAQVRVRERAKGVPEARGGAIMLRSEGFDIYEQRLGIRFESGAHINDRRQSQDGVVATQKYLGSESMTWSGFVRALHSSVDHLPNFDFQSGREAVRVNPSWHRPTVTYADGSTESADLVVVADGANSRCMDALGAQRADVYAGYVAWRGQLPEPPSTAPDRLEEYLTSEGTAFVSFPIYNRDAPGGPQRQLSWTLFIRHEEAELINLAGRYANAGIIPPGRVPKATVDLIRAIATERLPKRIADVVASPLNTYFGRIIRDLPSDSLPAAVTFPGVAVVGDAAYAPRPFTARSSTKAAEDALALKNALFLRRSVRAALDLYSKAQLSNAQFVASRVRLIDLRTGIASGDERIIPVQDEIQPPVKQWSGLNHNVKHLVEPWYLDDLWDRMLRQPSGPVDWCFDDHPPLPFEGVPADDYDFRMKYYQDLEPPF